MNCAPPSCRLENWKRCSQLDWHVVTGGLTPGSAHADAHFDACPRANPLHCLDEIEAKVLLREGEDVALLAALEAGVAALRRDGEIVVFAVMKRTRAAKAVADALQLHELADDRDDVRLVANTVDDVVGNHANSASVLLGTLLVAFGALLYHLWRRRRRAASLEET